MISAPQSKSPPSASRKRRFFPFNAEQTINILSEFGPLATMFIVNALYNINTGTWALILTTMLAIAVMFYMFGRPPVFPLIASTVTIVFGALTIITGDPMWVQIKVTIFNAMFAAFLFIGLWLDRNFFQYVFGKTFHYTQQGWNTFTRSFAWFFVFTAVLNEVVRLTFHDTQIYNILGHEMSGVNIWILFKIALIMPLSGLYAWLLTRWMQRHRLPTPDEDGDTTPLATTAATAQPVTDLRHAAARPGADSQA
jgi:intracellular septation protein